VVNVVDVGFRFEAQFNINIVVQKNEVCKFNIPILCCRSVDIREFDREC
jgi:hypothetical protein